MLLTKYYYDQVNKTDQNTIIQQISNKVLPIELTKKVTQLIYFILEEKSMKKKIKLLAALIYVICIFDAVPDFIPILGFMDDMSVVLYTLSYYINTK